MAPPATWTDPVFLDETTYRDESTDRRPPSVSAVPAGRAGRDVSEDTGRDEVGEVAQALSRIHRVRDRHRVLAAAVIVAAAVALWFTRDLWRPLVVPANPYDATPAENFAVGEAGFVEPPPQAVDSMSAAAVAAALDHTRRALIASYLDPRLLTGHDGEQVLGMLAPDSAVVVRPRLASGGYGTTLVRLAPGATLAAPPRVNGRLGYMLVDWSGLAALDVTSNYVIVYAFTGSAQVVVVHAETHWMFPLGAALRPSSRGMYLGRTSGYWHGMDCAAAGRGLTAPAPTVDRSATPAYHDPDPLDAYFDRHRPVDITSGCR